MSINDPIGVFDSGIGGLTVVRELMRQIPDERIVYFGDTARVPYGSKSKNTIVHYAEQILRFLTTKNVKAIVVACNTVSAYALEEIRHEVDVPMIGVVKPGAKVASHSTRNKKVGVIGTEATINSGMYTKYIKKLDPEIEVVGKACPLFCPLVEAGWWHDPITTQVAERYLQDMKEAGVDSLIMGCTHYPLIRSTIHDVMGAGVNLVNPAYETAVETRRILEWKDIVCDQVEDDLQKKYQFYVSDDPAGFNGFASSVLRFSIPAAQQINIEAF